MFGRSDERKETVGCEVNNGLLLISRFSLHLDARNKSRSADCDWLNPTR